MLARNTDVAARAMGISGPTVSACAFKAGLLMYGAARDLAAAIIGRKDLVREMVAGITRTPHQHRGRRQHSLATLPDQRPPVL